MSIRQIKFNDGTSCPAVAFGTALRAPTDEVNPLMLDKIKLAIKNGYRHIDTAESYKTEIEVGIAIEESGIPREDFYIASKVHPNLGNIKNVEQAVRNGLKATKLEYFDLYYLHHPFITEEELGTTIEDVWRQLEAVQKKGLVRSLGISNFRPAEIKRVLDIATVKPVVNQIELNPYFFERDIVEFNQKHDIVTATYGPLIPIARHKEGPLIPLLDTFATKYNQTPAQILLRWQLQLGFLPITSSRDNERQRTQLDLENFELSEEDAKKITEVGGQYQYQLFGWGMFRKSYETGGQNPYPFDLFTEV